MHSWTDVQFTDRKVESIACIAPETNTLTDWRKATLSIEYADEIQKKQLKTMFCKHLFEKIKILLEDLFIRLKSSRGLQ